MKRPPFSPAGPTRKVQADSGRPLGFLPSIKDQVNRLASDVEGLELRLRRRLSDGEPESIVARKVFEPETKQAFAWDYLQDNSSSQQVCYVVRDGVTYDIPIVFPPPGVFVARYLIVKMWQRTYDNVQGIAQNLPILFGNQMMRVGFGDAYPTPWGLDQTPKFGFPIGTLNGQAYSTALAFSRRMNFFWNMIDMKSSSPLADHLLPDQLLLPQAMGSSRVGLGGAGMQSFSNGRYEFRRPWLFERDGQASFQFRPITPILQPIAGQSTATPYLEGGAVNMSVTVQIELHGSRYVTMRDALQLGTNFSEKAVIR